MPYQTEYPQYLSLIFHSLLPLQQSALPGDQYKVIRLYSQKTAISFDKIHYIEAEGNYGSIQTGERKYVQKLLLSKLISELDDRFIQIHKSVIVNKDPHRAHQSQ